jgi:hypothetical protein
VLEECVAPIIRVKTIGELGATLVVTSNKQLATITDKDVYNSLILFTLIMEEISSAETLVIANPHITFQKTAFLIVT